MNIVLKSPFWLYVTQNPLHNSPAQSHISFTEALRPLLNPHTHLREPISWRLLITVNWTWHQWLPDNNAEKPFEDPILLTIGTHLQAEIAYLQSLRKIPVCTEYCLYQSLYQQRSRDQKKELFLEDGHIFVRKCVDDLAFDHNAREDND